MKQKQIVGRWLGRLDVGWQASLVNLDGIAEARLDLVPLGEGLDKPHTLFVTTNPGVALPDRDAGNNALTLTIGGVAAPMGLGAEVKPGSPLVFPNWEEPAGGSSAGYRIYRAEDGRSSK